LMNIRSHKLYTGTCCWPLAVPWISTLGKYVCKQGYLHVLMRIYLYIKIIPWWLIIFICIVILL